METTFRAPWEAAIEERRPGGKEVPLQDRSKGERSKRLWGCFRDKLVGLGSDPDVRSGNRGAIRPRGDAGLGMASEAALAMRV